MTELMNYKLAPNTSKVCTLQISRINVMRTSGIKLAQMQTLLSKMLNQQYCKSIWLSLEREEGVHLDIPMRYL